MTFDVRIPSELTDNYLNSSHHTLTYQVQDFAGPKYSLYDIKLKPEIIEWCNRNNIEYGFRYELSYSKHSPQDDDDEQRYYIILNSNDDILHFKLTWG